MPKHDVVLMRRVMWKAEFFRVWVRKIHVGNAETFSEELLCGYEKLLKSKSKCFLYEF